MTVSCAGWQHRWSNGACRWDFAPIGCMVARLVGAVAPYRAPTAAKLVPDIKAKLRDSRSSLAMTSFDPPSCPPPATTR